MFRFKQFTISQEHSPMKVGTDGVLLGAWVRIAPSVRRILDIGTGTGVIALMLAQRTQERPEVRITALDVGEVAEARANADASPWGVRVETVQCPVQRFAAAERYDLIVSNPPFFVGSLTSPDAGRTRVRHAEELPFGELHDAVGRLLAPDGRFALVLPPAEAELFLAESPALRVVRRTEVRSTPRRGVRRVLLELVRKSDCPHDGGSEGSTPSLQTESASPRDMSCTDSVCSPLSNGFLPEGSAAPADGYLAGLPLPSASGPSPLPRQSSARSSGPSRSLPSSGPRSSGPLDPCAEDCERDTLTIGTGAHEEYTKEYRTLTRDFYLKF